MPLRAKMLSQQQQQQQAQISTQAAAELFKPIEGDEPEDVIFDSLYGLRTIALNRPKKLNALNGSMIRKITPRLLEWSKSGIANVIVMKGAGEKAFCAGGDVAALAKLNTQGEEGQHKSTEYFALEYQLDHLIATYNKPYIAFMDGITMGGGVGLSIHAPLRIATERTVFAMPETTIGFFPDVGASFFLPRMSGSVGTYLALTSARLTGANVFYSGVATHYLHSTSLPALESRLAELRFKDYDTMETRLSVINATIGEFRTGLPYDQPQLLQGELRKAIDRCFRHNTLSEILAALHAEKSPATRQWAQDTIKTLHERSPTAVHVALRQMRIGSKWSISKTFQREHQIAAKFMKHPDFTEGVTALLIEKREPKWQPASIEDTKPEDNIAEPFFEINRDLKPVELLTDVDYHEYPYAAGLGVPSEKEVEAQVMQGVMTGPQIKRHFIKQSNGLEGVDAVVGEILERKTIPNEEGRPTWVYQEEKK
ncbi:ClpP/crotonase-like domain-containing protein [Cercophora scortea]|uniref:3-hydroxyisobutyryl-CoA hydrolase n=1 Tax=Cercophora scortea TaxID=314031 RepID=A0AAE0IMP1_9PEZI|nr:ClpP/crotonase-like domain-containing protein [Cercophora scortea]